MTDDLSRRRIVNKPHLEIPDDPSANAKLLREGWIQTGRWPMSRAAREQQWEVRNHCALSIDDDGALAYVSFAHHNRVRFPTLTCRMIG